MTADQLLALAARLPPNIRRLEFTDDQPSGAGSVGHVVIEAMPAFVPSAAPAAAPPPAPKPSDVDSLSRIPPGFTED